MVEVNIETINDKHTVWCLDYEMRLTDNMCSFKFENGYLLEGFKRNTVIIAYFPLHNLVSIIETEANNE